MSTVISSQVICWVFLCLTQKSRSRWIAALDSQSVAVHGHACTMPSLTLHNQRIGKKKKKEHCCQSECKTILIETVGTSSSFSQASSNFSLLPNPLPPTPTRTRLSVQFLLSKSWAKCCIEFHGQGKNGRREKERQRVNNLILTSCLQPHRFVSERREGKRGEETTSKKRNKNL